MRRFFRRIRYLKYLRISDVANRTSDVSNRTSDVVNRTSHVSNRTSDVSNRNSEVTNHAKFFSLDSIPREVSNLAYQSEGFDPE